MKHQRLLATAVASLAIVSLGACSSSSTSSATTPGTAAVTVPSATDATTTEATTAGSAVETAGSGSVDAGSLGTAADGSVASDNSSEPTLAANASQECKDLFTQFRQLENLGAGQFPSEATVTKAFASMKSFVPAELKADVDTFGVAYGKLATAVNAAGGDYSKAATDPNFQKVLADISQPDVEAAANRVGAYLEKTCPTG